MNSAPQYGSQRSDPRGHLVEQLRRQMRHWEPTATEDVAVFSSGAEAIDRLLPGGGLRHGMLVEWLSAPGGSAATLSLLSAREACREGGEFVVIDRRQTFYPPAAVAWGIDLNRLIVVHPRTARDELWAAVQSLRSPAVAAVWATIEQLDHRAFRRLQLAAQAGRTLGLLLRSASVRGQPSWADVRLGVETIQGDRETRRQGDRSSQTFSLSPPLLVSLSGSARRIQVCVLRSRGGQSGNSVMLEIDDAIYNVRQVSLSHDTHPLSVVTELADPASRSMSARA